MEGMERREGEFRRIRGNVPQSPLPELAVAEVVFRDPHREEREGVVTLASAPPGRIQLSVQGVVPRKTRKEFG